MSDELLNEQKEKYRKNFLAHGDNPEGVFWNNKKIQFFRFERLLKNFNLSPGFSIHDIGCGTAALHEYLLEKDIKHKYYGSEIVPDMVATARKKFTDINIEERDILTVPDIETCDISVVSGTFNLGGQQPYDAWKAYVFRVMKRMFEISEKGIAVNFLTCHRTFTDKMLFYADPAEVLNFCITNLSRYVILDHAYPLYEFTVTILKSSYTHTQYRGDADFEKYFKNDK